MPPLHHVSIGMNDMTRARSFYDPLMQLLGLRLLKSDDSARHYGIDEIIFSVQRPVDGNRARPGFGVHIAFEAPDRATVDAFYAEAIRLGGTGDGVPGLRAQYSPDYYGAFVLDPEGNKIEAMIEG